MRTPAEIVEDISIAIQGEAGAVGYEAMAGCAGSMLARALDQTAPCVDWDKILSAYCALTNHKSGKNPVVVGDVAKGFAYLVYNRLLPASSTPYYMGQLDVDANGWKDGDVVIRNSRNGLANHAYKEWPEYKVWPKESGT